MSLRVLLVIASALSTGRNAFPDIVDVTVNGSVTGLDNLAVGCAPVTPGCVSGLGGSFFPVSDSFSGTNTKLGDFSASGSAVDPFATGVSVQSFVRQSTTATTDALEISLTGNYFGHPAPAFTGVHLNDSVAVSFNLTEESTIQFDDPPVGLPFSSFDDFSFSGELLDSKGNVILVVQRSGTGTSGGFLASTVLQPGTYQLDASVMGTALGGNGVGLQGSFGADLNTTFTPVVPEPRCAILAGVLASLLGGYVVSRRRWIE